MIISIDPGISGAVAGNDEGETHIFKMPETPRDLFILILSMKTDDAFCWIEQVGSYMPNNSGPAAVKFARHCGHLDMALVASGIPYDYVLPTKWEHWLIGKPNYPKIDKNISKQARQQILSKRTQERKNKIKTKIQALYPNLKITLQNADAIGILHWALNNNG